MMKNDKVRISVVSCHHMCPAQNRRNTAQELSRRAQLMSGSIRTPDPSLNLPYSSGPCVYFLYDLGILEDMDSLNRFELVITTRMIPKTLVTLCLSPP
jgi:hypothetical protein